MDLESIVMMQLNMKQDLKQFGQPGVDAVQVEMKKLHDCAVLKPVITNQLFYAEKKAALQYLMFLKQK